MSKRPPSDYGAGYGRPPAGGQFKKGKSGNPKGRPKGRHVRPPYDAVLGQVVTVREGNTERQVTAAEAFLLKITQSGLEGDTAAARQAVAAIEHARSNRPELARRPLESVTISFACVSSINQVLEALRMATKLNRNLTTAAMVLEPWIVQAALSRFGDRRLSREEQDKVLRSTRTPHKVKWPEWWEVRP